MRVGVTKKGMLAVERTFPNAGQMVAVYDHDHYFRCYDSVEVVEEWAPWAFDGAAFATFWWVDSAVPVMVVERRGRWAVGVVSVQGSPMMGVWLDGRVRAISRIPPRWRRLQRIANTLLVVGGGA